MTSGRNLGVQTLFYGLRKSRKNMIPLVTIPSVMNYLFEPLTSHHG